MNTLIIPLSHGVASADLILQFGPGTENPSVMIQNHHAHELIELGEIQRFPDSVMNEAKKK